MLVNKIEKGSTKRVTIIMEVEEAAMCLRNFHINCIWNAVDVSRHGLVLEAYTPHLKIYGDDLAQEVDRFLREVAGYGSFIKSGVSPDLAEKAAFSPHELSPEERAAVIPLPE